MKVYIFQVYFFNLNFVPKTTPFVLIFDRTFLRSSKIYFTDIVNCISLISGLNFRLWRTQLCPNFLDPKL